MKQIIAAAIIIAGLSACTGGGSNDAPKTVLKNFLEHVQKKDFTAAKKLGTNNTKAIIDLQIQMTGILDTMGRSTEELQTPLAVMNLKDFDITCTENDNKTTCKACSTDKNCENFTMVSENGEWKVDMQKESNVPQN